MKYAFSLIFLLTLGWLIPAGLEAQVARMSLEQLPPAYVVSETSEQVAAVPGCQLRTFDNETRSFLLDPASPYPVIPSNTPQDTPQSEIFFCSKEAVGSLTVIGQVAGLVDRVVGAIAKGFEHVVGAVGNVVSKVVGPVVALLAAILANVFIFIMNLAASGATYFLAFGGFLTHPAVRAGWPFVLGFANLGFVLALLFIALSTVLRIEGFQARRMLPRLLIAALLINFSLIIAVFIIDASRLVMAVLAQGIANTTGCTGSPIECMPANVLANSKLVEAAFHINAEGALLKNQVTPKLLSGVGVVDAVAALMTVALMTLAYVVLAGILMMRWFMLIILLILSPLAYLFVALPGTAGYARQWWQQFIKYVVLGPAIVFVLAIFSQAQGSIYDSLRNFFDDRPAPIRDTLASVAMTGVTALFLFGAAGAGQQLGTMGGNLAANAFRRPTVGAARLAGKGLYVGTGTRYALRRAGEAAGDLRVPGTNIGVRNYRNWLARRGAQEKRRKEIKDESIHLAEEQGRKDAEHYRGLGRRGYDKSGKPRSLAEWAKSGFQADESHPEFQDIYHERYLGYYDSKGKREFKEAQRDNGVNAINLALQMDGGLSNLTDIKMKETMAKIDEAELEELFQQMLKDANFDNFSAQERSSIENAQTVDEKKKALSYYVSRSLRAEDLREEQLVHAIEHGEFTDAEGKTYKNGEIIDEIFEKHGSGKAIRSLMNNRGLMRRLGTRHRRSLAPRLRNNKNIKLDDIAPIPPEVETTFRRQRQAILDRQVEKNEISQKEYNEGLERINRDWEEYAREIMEHQYIKAEDNLDSIVGEFGQVIRNLDKE